MASALKSLAFDIGKASLQAKVAGDPDGEPTSFRRTATTMAAGHATSLGKAAGKKWLNAYITIPRIISRVLQLILALVAAGVYGSRLSAQRDAGESMAPDWIFAVFVGAVSAITALLFTFSTPLAMLSSRFETYKLFWWDFILTLFWLIMFGVFAVIFLKRTDEEGDYKGASTKSMKAMVWVDLICAILWLATGIFGAMRKMASRKADAMSEAMVDKMFSKQDTQQGTYEMQPV